MRKILIILAVVLFVGEARATKLFVSETRATNLKGKFGAGLEISHFCYCHYAYGNYDWVQGIRFQDLELMYGLTTYLALIVGGGMPDINDLRLKFGLQFYVTETEAVSPYLKVSLNFRNYGYEYQRRKFYDLKWGAGMEYFWTEHLGLAIHVSFVTLYLRKVEPYAETNMVPGIYFWIRK